MPPSRPDPQSLLGRDVHDVPMSAQRVLGSAVQHPMRWIGPEQVAVLSDDEASAYAHAHTIMRHLAVRAPTAHSSGHPGGPLSAFTFAYFASKRRDPSVDQPMRYSAGHLSLLAYGLQWMLGRDGNDKRLASVQSIIDTFRTPDGLPGHVEAGIGDIPFGTGPLGKGVSNALGVAFGLKHQNKPGVVDVLLADGDSQEGQVMEAFRLAPHLGLDNLIVHGDFNDIQLSGIPSRTVASDFSSMALACGWHVIEVQNGNDPRQVVAALNEADKLKDGGAPVFICYYTTMGHGIAMMEEGSNSGDRNFHGAPLKQEEADKVIAQLPDLNEAIEAYAPAREREKMRYAIPDRIETDIPLVWSMKGQAENGYTRSITAEKGAARKDFGATHLRALMKADERIVVLHADLGASGGFDKVEKEFPHRCLNVGVAEANMYMMAAGMRQTGLLPVTYTFAAFGTNEARANARLIDVNCGHTRCAVVHDCTHAGLSVGEDGETHQERNYLNMPLDHHQVWSLADSNQAAAAAERALELIAEGHTSVYVFSPRSGHPQIASPDGQPIYGPNYVFDGKADLVRGAGDITDQVTILATGITIHAVIAAADALATGDDKVRVRVLNVACIRPLDAAAVLQAALETRHLIVVEDHHSEGGLATQVADVLADFTVPCTLRRLGVNHYFPSATDKELFFLAGIDAESIAAAVQDEVRAEICGGEDALVTCVFELLHNVRKSRFRDTANNFLQRLLTEENYLDSLRASWKERACPPDQLPSNKDLLERLREML